MAFEINDLKGFFILVLFAIPRVASTNINCSGRAFHCVNSTHFMICVDLGGGVSTTIDDFVIPCPATTVCHENNIFECDFPEVTTPSLHVIGVSKQSDTSETLVTNSVITTTPTSDISDVFKENFTATTLPTAEDVTPVVKLEVLENIMNSVGANSDNTTETRSKVTSNFIDSGIETVTDKQTSDNITTTLAIDNNNKNLETDVRTSSHEPVYSSPTDKSTFLDTATSIIGLINLISTDPPSVVSIKPSYNVLTSLDISNDNKATTTAQYDTKEVTIHGENAKNNLNIPTDITFTEKSVITDEYNTPHVPNTLILNDTSNKIESKNQTSDNLNIVEQNEKFSKDNPNKNLGNTKKIVPETTTKYVASIKTLNISEPIIVALNPQTTTDNTLVSSGAVDLIPVKPEHNMPSTNDYTDSFYGDTATSTTNQFNSKLETILSKGPVNMEIITTTPIETTTLQSVSQSDKNSDLIGEIVTVENVTETDKNSFITETVTVASRQTSTQENFVSITTEATTVYPAGTTATSEVLLNNDSPVEKQTIVNQPLELIPTDTPVVVTDTIYQIHGYLNKTLISSENTSVDTSTIEISTTVINSSNADIVNDKVTTPVLLPPATVKNPVIEITTAEPFQNAFTTPVIEVKNEMQVKSVPIIANERYLENVNNYTLLNNNEIFLNSSTVKTALNASTLDIYGKGTESTTVKSLNIEISTTESLQAESTKYGSEVKNEFKTTNVDGSNLINHKINTVMSVYSTPASSKVPPDSVTNATIKGLTSQSGIVKNPQTSFTTDIVYQTTDRVVTDPVNKITTHLNQLINLETVTFPDNLKIDNIDPTPFPIDLSIKAVNTQDNLLLSQESPGAPYVPAITKNTSNISDTTRINVEPEKVYEPVPTRPESVDIYTTVAMGNKIETTITLPVDFRSITNIKNDGDVTTTLPPLEVTSISIDRVRLLNATSAIAEMVGEIVPIADKSVGHVVSHTEATDLNTQTLIDFAYSETTTSQIDADFNNTATVRPIAGNIHDITTTPPSPVAHTTKDENIAIKSVFIVNASGNMMPNKTLQLRTSYSSLLNDYIKSSETQASSGYVTATKNVPDNNSVNESATQKMPEAILPSAERKVMNSVLSTANTHTLPSTGINTGKNKFISTESPVPGTIELKHIIPTTTDYVTEKSNDYFSTEAMLSQSNKRPNVQADFLVSSASSVAVASNGFTTLPVNNEFTTIKDSSFIISSTQTPPEIVTDNNINMSTELPRLTSKVVDPQIVKYNIVSTLPITELTVAQTTTEPTPTTNVSPEIVTDNNINMSTELPRLTSKVVDPQIVKYNIESTLPITELTVAQTTTEPTPTTNVFVQTTPVVQPRVKTIGLPQYFLRTVNENTPQLMPSLTIAKFTPAQMTTEYTHSTIIPQTTSLAATGDMNQSVSGKQKVDLPQYVTTTVNNMVEVTAAPRTTKPTQTSFLGQTTPYDNTNDEGIKTTNSAQYMTTRVNNNAPQSMPLLHMLQATVSKMITHTTDATLFAQTTPLSATGTTNPGVLPRMETTDLPQYMMLKTSDSITKSIPSQPVTGLTSQITTEPTHTTTTFADTTPLAVPSKTDQNILIGILTKDLPQYVTTIVTYKNPQSITDVKTEAITDSLIAPDTMVETIKIVGDEVSGTPLGESIRPFTNHESIVIRATSKTLPGKPVDNNKAEIVNHTESNWMPSDVNIDSITIKESSIEEKDLKSSVSKSVTNVKNKTMISDSAIISKIQPRTGLSDDKFESTTVTTYYKQAELAPKNVSQLNTKITKETKHMATDTPGDVNIEIIDVKKYQVPFDSKNVSDTYSSRNNMKTNTSPHHNLSLQNSTINDELEQHLISTNHTITAEEQSHLNESDKQSNKTSYELTLNVTSIHNPNLNSTKLNASSKDTTVITVPVSVFSCLNVTRGKYADKKDCRKFYTCIGNLQPLLGTCPNNTVFSEINKQCTRNLSHCVRNNQFRCLFEGRFSDFFKDNIYYICVKNRINGFTRYKLQCQNSYHLNKDSVKCEKNEEISTQSSSSVSEMINDESKIKPKSEKIVSPDNFECEKEGNFPYVKDCSKYYVCTKIKNVYRRKIVKCASDEVFDKEKKKCVESDSGEC